jgi:hypothetical protein
MRTFCNKTIHLTTTYTKEPKAQNQETEKQFERLIKENELLIFKVCRI